MPNSSSLLHNSSQRLGTGNNFGKVLRNIALAFRLQIRPAVNSPEGLKFLESMLHMLTAVYASVAESVPQSRAGSWASGFLEGMRYQLRRMLGVLLECLQKSNTPKRFWVRTVSYTHLTLPTKA